MNKLKLLSSLCFLVFLSMSCTKKKEETITQPQRPAPSQGFSPAQPPPTPPTKAEKIIPNTKTYDGKSFFELVPGKSIADAYIGEGSLSLSKKGFTLDTSSGDKIMKRDNIYVRLVNDKAVEITFKGPLSKIKYNQRGLLPSNDPSILMMSFRDCNEPALSQANKVVYCQKYTVKIKGGKKNTDSPELSVIDPSAIKR